MGAVNLTQLKELNRGFCEEVSKRSGQDIRSCYQCGKCTAGCPVSYASDYGPRQIMRMVQLEMKDQCLESEMIWNCACCYTCTARCPRDIDVASVMEALRMMSRSEGKVADTHVTAFNDIFLDSIKSHGRVHELELILRYNMATRQPMKDAAMGPAMFLKRKIALLPSQIEGATAVRKIMEKSLDAESGGESK